MEYVKLKSTDLDILVEICQEIVTYKYHALSKHNWLEFEKKYLPSLLLQINRNQFKVITATNNTFTWLIDQIVNSRKYIPGIDRKLQIPLFDTSLGEQALQILRAAKNGQASYDRYCLPNQFNDLFENL